MRDEKWNAYFPTASFTHLFVKLVLAAPANFFSEAAVSHDAFASRSHFCMKLVLAAPASFFSPACVAQEVSAALTLVTYKDRMLLSRSRIMVYLFSLVSQHSSASR